MLQGETVAVKKLKVANAALGQTEMFIQRIQLTNRLESPYIVKIIGAAWFQPYDIMCIMEWMDGGDLRAKFSARTSATFRWHDKYDCIYHILQALAYLHSINLIHNDLKSRNILLDSTKLAKLMDVSTSQNFVGISVTTGVGTVRWMPPEAIHDRGHTSAVDIYSFGINLSEIDCHLVPFEDKVNPVTGEPLSELDIIMSLLRGTLQPTFTKQCPEWVHSMAMQCISYNPSDRQR
ncbi:hypothetical protein AC1031_011032 [Aphanomyces cochlioides]|nr:hypothetical protein AC1031_011032 [Aphanomyces cochlioides]